MKSATAFAPASVANAGVGFDILGFALSTPGDRVTARKLPGSGEGSRVTIRSITGVVEKLPLNPGHNTASVAVQHLLSAANAVFNVELEIEKGIPLGSGLGGSAASAVAAVVAANALLDKPLKKTDLLASALAGEAVATGSVHADNVAPSLLGGLQLIYSTDPLRTARVQVPSPIHATVVHPNMTIETKQARAILRPEISRADFVQQSGHLAGFIMACLSGDLDMLAETLRDDVIEPQRAGLIPGFAEAKKVALEAGALGFSISGSGPSVFAWSKSAAAAKRIAIAVEDVFHKQNLQTLTFAGRIAKTGARLE